MVVDMASACGHQTHNCLLFSFTEKSFKYKTWAYSLGTQAMEIEELAR
jgi:hypothetical protein